MRRGRRRPRTLGQFHHFGFEPAVAGFEVVKRSTIPFQLFAQLGVFVLQLLHHGQVRQNLLGCLVIVQTFGNTTVATAAAHPMNNENRKKWATQKKIWLCDLVYCRDHFCPRAGWLAVRVSNAMPMRRTQVLGVVRRRVGRSKPCLGITDRHGIGGTTTFVYIRRPPTVRAVGNDMMVASTHQKH